MKPFYFVCKCNIYSNHTLFQFTLLCAFLKKEKKKTFVSWGEDSCVMTSHPLVQLKNTRSEENGYNNINNNHGKYFFYSCLSVSIPLASVNLLLSFCFAPHLSRPWPVDISLCLSYVIRSCICSLYAPFSPFLPALCVFVLSLKTVRAFLCLFSPRWDRVLRVGRCCPPRVVSFR